MLTDKAKEIISGVKSKMEDSVLFLEEDLKTYRVGKANPSILNNVTMEPRLLFLRWLRSQSLTQGQLRFSLGKRA